MSFNVWVNHGTAIPQVTNDAPEQPTVLYESGAQILAPNPDGKVFKMWFTTGPATSPIGINYAESNDGLTWTRFGSNPLVATRWGGRVFKNGNTYYLYCTAQFISTAIQVYTSPDGITWTLQNASALTAGASGWDSVAIGQLNVLTVDGAGTWWGYYWGIDTLVSANQFFKAGLATSTDGINWVKGGSNPVITSGTLGNGTNWNIATAFTFATVSGVYYGWSQMTALSYPGGTTQLPSDIMRWKATNPAGPWTALGVETYSRFDPSESPNNAVGQVADPSILSALGNLYLYHTASVNGASGTTYTVNVAVAPSTTFSQLVSTYEGVQNVPLSGNPDLNLNVLASDNFNRADANPIGGNWTQLSSAANFTAAQISSNRVLSNTVGIGADSWWNPIAWAADQWSKVTVSVCSAASFVGVSLRQNTAGVRTAYRFFWNGSTGSSGTWTIQSVVNNVFTSLATGNLTVNVGDVLLACAVGSTLSFYWNGLLIGTVTDANIATGAPGFLVTPITSTANAAIDNWSAGSFQTANLAFSYQDDRTFGAFPNHLRLVQGTSIYDVVSSESRVSPNIPIDSRKSPNIPVDSRVSPNIPTNSRNTPT